MSHLPISDYAFISDCHSGALVSREGSIDWLCFPRFDKPSTFGRLLDDQAGHWSIRPLDATASTRRFMDATMVLETSFQTRTGSVRIQDALAVGANERGHDLGSRSPHLLVDVAEAAAARWEEPDQGIWEVRGGPRHFVYSKLMCWVALDRAIYLAGRLGNEERVDTWRKTRDEIRDAILQRGWSERAQAFAQAFGSDELDASNLMMPIVGFLPAKDPRVLATIRGTEERLTDEHGLVFRYKSADGLEGEEGSFLLCTFWLAQAQALAGRLEPATQTFERAIAFVNDVGLLAEEVDPKTKELLGNFPQAFSHIGLVNAAWAIAQAEKGLTPGGSPL